MVRKIAIGLALQWKLNSKRENEIHSTMRIRIIYIMMIACTMLQSCDDFFDKTGDDSNLMLWTMLGLSALLCAGGVGILMYKKNRNAG